MATDEIKPLCALCDDFTKVLTACVRKSLHTTPSPKNGERFETAEWRDSMTTWKGVYKHHSSLAGLVSGAEACDLCRLLKEDLARLAGTAGSTTEEYGRGWLGLYFRGDPAFTTISGGLRSLCDVFRAGFSESLGMMPPRKAPNNNPPLMYRVCLRDEAKPPSRPPTAGPRAARMIPEDGTSPAVFDMASTWLAACVQDHVQCRERPATQAAGDDGPLPTRVLDVDAGLGGEVKLLVSAGQKAPYVALSHCWGGNIPNKTIKSTLEAQQHGIPIASLPQNFQDAISITRKLQLRYLWIDALCIVQDDAADWAREAALMAEVYSYSTVTVTGLDSPCSTAGILRRHRLGAVVVPGAPEYAIQGCADSLPVAMGNCVLSERAWCLQERFLPPRLLHFGSAQVHWECRTATAAEDDRSWDWEGSGLAVRNLVNSHRRLGEGQASSEHWYKVVEEYSMRRLTFGKDKLPAMMGTSQMFGAKNGGLGGYVAGLWRGELAKGLCWGASLVAFKEVRKRPGYASNDEVAEFRRPDKARAPSWSWASVDGSVYFPCSRTVGGKPWVGEIEVVDVQLDAEGSAGRLVVGGRVGVFDYSRSQQPHGGTGVLSKAGDEEGESMSAGICVLDFDRRRARAGCHALLVASSNMPRAYACFLVLDKRADGTFRRIGLSTIFNWADEQEGWQKKVEGLAMQQLTIE